MYRNIVFSYELRDAFNNNVAYIRLDENRTVRFFIQGQKEETHLPVPDGIMREVFLAVSRYENLLQAEDIEKRFVMDGFSQVIYLCSENEGEIFYTSNLALMKGKDKYPKANQLISFLEEMKKLFATIGVDSRCFALSKE